MLGGQCKIAGEEIGLCMCTRRNFGEDLELILIKF